MKIIIIIKFANKSKNNPINKHIKLVMENATYLKKKIFQIKIIFIDIKQLINFYCIKKLQKNYFYKNIFAKDLKLI